MNVLIVIPAVGLIYGGTSKVAFDIAQALGDCGVQVDVVTTNANGSINLEVPLQAWQRQGSYRIQYFPRWGLGEYKLSYSLTSWLMQHVRDYDVVHTISLFTYPVAIAHWICQLRKVPYIVSPHGMLEPWALNYKAWKKRLYYTLIEQPILRRADAIQMLSQAEVNGVQELALTTPIVVVPNGVHRRDFDPLPKSDPFYQSFPKLRDKTLILFLGRVDPKKGLDLLAKAFSQVYQQFPETHLVVAGPDNTGFLPSAQCFFAEAGCLEHVTFTGMLTGTLKQAALAAATLYVAPSYSEGFSISVLEGMAFGLPCVITEGCNFPEAITAQAADVVAIDADAIAQAMIQRLADPEAAQAIGDRARRFIFEHYAWDQIAATLIETYQAVLQPTTYADKHHTANSHV